MATSLTDLNQQRKLAAAKAKYDAAHPAPAAAPLTDLELGKLAAASTAPAVSAPVPAQVPTTPLTPAPSIAAPAAVAPSVTAASTAVPTPPPAAVPVTPAAPSAATTAVTDPNRAAVTSAPATVPQTTAVELPPATSQFTPAQQAAIDLQRTITPDMPLAQQRQIKAQFNAMYQALPSQEERLAVIHELQAPPSANKLAGVRYSATIPIKRGESDLSDEQLAKLALAQQVKESLGPNANAAETQAAFTAALQTPGALETPEIRAAVAAATSGLDARSTELNALGVTGAGGAPIDLAGAREAQQAATAAATAQAITERLEANIAGTNIGGGQFIGGTPGQVVRSDTNNSDRLPSVPAALPPAGTPVATGLPLQRSPFLEFDQRPLAQLAGERGAVLPSQPAPLSATSLSASEARVLNPGATLAADPVRTQALIDRLQQEADAGTRNPNNAAAQISQLKAKLAIGAPTGRSNAEIFADPTLTREQRLAEMSLNSKKTPAAALGIRPIQVTRAKSGQSDLSSSQLIALARALTPAGQPLPTTLAEANALLQSGTV